jgi:uncharacterized membrane-anchored protein YjiN (DUF445 family)
VTEQDLERRRRLRRMQRTATGLLVLSAVVYWVTVDRGGWVGYLNAAAEAAVIGAIADWFAVTALFRHPLRLPIPHTALVPRRKDEIGKGLEEFVVTSFLSEPVVRDKVRRAEPARRLGEWLSERPNAERVAAEGSVLAGAALRVLRDDDVVAVLEHAVIRRLGETPVSPLAGRLLEGVVEDGSHRPLFDLALDEAAAWLRDNRRTVIRIVLDRAPQWTPDWLDAAVAARVHQELTRWVADVSADPDHRVRKAVDDLLVRLAEDLQSDPETQARAEALKDRFLAHPQTGEAVGALWSSVRRLLLEAAEDPHGELRRRAVRGLTDAGRRLAEDAVLQERVDSYAADAAGYVARGYSAEIAAVISETVSRWDPAETSERIELHVGRDLQFIRINGTVVGALVGLVLHTMTELVI